MKIQSSKLNSKLIILSNITSKLGNVVFDYTNQMLITMIAPTSPKFMAFYQFSENIVSILFNLFAGAIIDKNSRKRLLLITDILSGCTCIVGIFFLKSPYVYISLIITNILLSIVLPTMRLLKKVFRVVILSAIFQTLIYLKSVLQ
ncbi:macrolide efflux ABC transporter permease [Streptococcus pneumoniae]|nr:macrolide efflux ABC transporter permease [Streptococcus pneumoniae]CIS88126.1 macrolide efflux ABC transporter permease [Streptococcus pneumoniae]CIT65448.1 macrolide efflux ABC transporter permease [Streptococcus pneumoniae]CIZ12727.1 macrolide efflux ABC transporter permease [Streptococcus pneumoniae]CJJ33577.1 macrolide efflux ABC transporter permease [Streptococcus pneumoniae]